MKKMSIWVAALLVALALCSCSAMSLYALGSAQAEETDSSGADARKVQNADTRDLTAWCDSLYNIEGEPNGDGPTVFSQK